MSVKKQLVVHVILSSFVLFFLICTAKAQEEKSNPYKSVAPQKNERCIICGVELTEEDVVLIVRGRRVPLNSAMVDSFLNNKDMYFRKLQPKGALFYENLTSGRNAALGGVNLGWFLFGSYILLGLIFGGMSGYAAVSKGLSPIQNFFIGFFLSVIGYLYVKSRPSVAGKGEIPAGLVKVPTTHEPVNCQKCGSENHPSADACSGCGAELKPVIDSEVSRAN